MAPDVAPEAPAPARRTSRLSRTRAAAAITALALVSALAVAVPSSAAPQVASVPAPRAAGTPGVPGNPVVVFHEDFETAPDTGSATALTAYASTSGVSYTAEGLWIDASKCNGFVMSASNTATPGVCDQISSWVPMQRLADVLGQVNGTAPTTNSVVAAYTVDIAPHPDNQIEFATDGESIPLPAANRFLTFSVNAAAANCFSWHPRLDFSYLRGGVETPISGASIDPCSDPRARMYGPTSDPTDHTFSAGEFASDGSFLSTAASIGIVMRNASGQTSGNDGAFDDIKLLDVTPQLDLGFAPAAVPLGGTSILTMTVTNTSELAAKNGWSFTNTLPAGLVIDDAPSVGGTCDGTIAAAAGSSTITVTGGVLDRAETSCTLTVPVTTASVAPVSYQNCPADISARVGLDLPACASVNFLGVPALSLVKTASVSNATIGDAVSYTITARNVGTGDYTIADPARFADDLTDVLDNATYGGSVMASRGAVTYSSPRVSWSGALAVGESVTVRYTVHVTERGDGSLRNVVFEGTPTAATPECASGSPIECDIVLTTVSAKPPVALAHTGSSVQGSLLTAGSLLLLGLLVLGAMVRRSRAL